MKVFANNRQLFDYLLALSSELKRRGMLELSEVVGIASRHAAGMSTEFLGESRIALRQVFHQGKDSLTEQERNDLSDVLAQLDTAFDKR
jgi:hypothetical protein